MKTIYLVRHGETAANRDDVFRGRNEISLSENGLLQSRGLVDYFRDVQLEKVYCSPLKRAVQTAEHGFPGMEIVTEELVNNLDSGSWTGVKKDDIRKSDPESWHMWTTVPEKLRFPGGETLSDVYSRATLFLEKMETVSFSKCVVVSHRSVIKVILAAFLGLKTDYFWRFHVDNASVSTLLLDEKRGFTLAKLNDTRHLESVVFEWF